MANSLGQQPLQPWGSAAVGGTFTGSEALYVDAYDATTATSGVPIVIRTDLLTQAIASTTTGGGASQGASIPNEPSASPVHLASAH